MIDRCQRQKRKRIKEYNQTRSVFCITWDAKLFNNTDLNQDSIIIKQCTERKNTYNSNELQKLTPIIIRKKNLISKQQEPVLTKMRYGSCLNHF